MSAGLDVDSIHCSVGIKATSAVPPQPFNPIAMSQLGGRPAVRCPQQLRLHSALDELGWTGLVGEFNDAARFPNPSVSQPVLITASGTVLAGFGRWQLAMFEGSRGIPCIEYPLNEDESLQFILAHHQIRRGWNDFVRIRLALTLRSSFRQRALDNMRTGGKCKGLANLPDVQRINVRDEIAAVAAVGSRSVGDVETILETAHPRLIEALRSGALKINRAMQLCRLPQAEQLEQFIRYSRNGRPAR
jgi:hypothetical protein